MSFCSLRTAWQHIIPRSTRVGGRGGCPGSFHVMRALYVAVFNNSLFFVGGVLYSPVNFGDASLLLDVFSFLYLDV